MAAAPGVDRLLGDWTFVPAALVAALAVAAAYLVAAARVRRWRQRRTLAFLAGVAVLITALQSGIDGYATDLLTVHMFQHLLITMAAAPLLVAGAPLVLALRALRGPWREALARVVHGRAAAIVTRPAVAWAAFASVLVATHAPSVYDLALREPAVHAVAHGLYLWTAVLFWTPLVAAEPVPHRLDSVGGTAYLLAAMVPMSVIGVWLLLAGGVVYPHYASAAPALGVSAAADQRDGAAVMWIAGTLVLVVAVAARGWWALAREERRARAREAYADRPSQRVETGS
jgi:cytochrome c oxidase assembly factor CtaG